MQIKFSIKINDELINFISNIFNKLNLTIFCLLFFMGVFFVYAASISDIVTPEVPNDFQPGTEIKASEINSNFDAIVSTVNSNNTVFNVMLKTNEDLIEELSDQIDDNTQTIANLNGNQSSLIEGMIMMWNKGVAQVPVGWAVCDGGPAVNGVSRPDLRERFVIGAYRFLDGDGNEESLNVGENGGSNNHTHVMQHKHENAYIDSDDFREKMKHRHKWLTIDNSSSSLYLWNMLNDYENNTTFMTTSYQTYKAVDVSTNGIELNDITWGFTWDGATQDFYTGEPDYAEDTLSGEDKKIYIDVDYDTFFSNFGDGSVKKNIFTSNVTKIASELTDADLLDDSIDASTGEVIIGADNDINDYLQRSEGNVPPYYSLVFIIYTGDSTYLAENDTYTTAAFPNDLEIIDDPD